MVTLKDLGFALVTAAYSLATTRLTVGLPLATTDDLINAACLGIVSAVGGLCAFRANPSGSTLDILKSVSRRP